MNINTLFKIDKFLKTGLEGEEIGENGRVKEKFSFGVICDKKSEKGGQAAYGRLRRRTASVFSASSAILQRCSSRTQWHFVPRDNTFALALPENSTRHQKHGQVSSGPKAIAPRCGRAPSVVSGKSPGGAAAKPPKSLLAMRPMGGEKCGTHRTHGTIRRKPHM